MVSRNHVTTTPLTIGGPTQVRYAAEFISQVYSSSDLSSIAKVIYLFPISLCKPFPVP